MTILKALKHESCLSLGTCHKYVVKFKELTPTIRENAQRNELTFKYASTKYNPIKTMFLYLKRNV